MSFELPSVTIERSKYAVQESWKLSAILSSDDARRVSDWSWMGQPKESEIVGVTDGGEEFRIPSAAGFSFSGREFRLDVYEIDFGKSHLETKPAEQHMTLYLTDTPLIQRRPSGPIDMRRHYYPEAIPFTWESPSGSMEIERTESSERVIVRGASATVEVPGVVIVGWAIPTHQTPIELVDKVEESLKPFLCVLSLLSRTRVSCHRIEVSSRDLDASPPVTADFARWRSVIVSERTVSRFPLVSPTDLERSEIDSMARRFAEFDGATHLATAIYFLSGWLDATFLEERIVNAFTSLEAVISGLPTLPDTDHPLATELLKRVRGDLRKYEAEYPPDLVEQTKRSLDAVTRRPMAKRVAALVQHYDVRTADLWPIAIGVEEAIRKSYTHRHGLIHRGELLDAEAASTEAFRIHALAERLLYAALGGNPAKIHTLAYRHLPG